MHQTSQMQDTQIKSIYHPCPSPTLPNNQGRDVGCLIFGARVATRCEGDVMEEGSPSTHPPSCYNESCLLGRSETATHIQSVCACDGGLANSKVAPPQTLAQTKKKGARGCTQSATHKQVPASTPRPPRRSPPCRELCEC